MVSFSCCSFLLLNEKTFMITHFRLWLSDLFLALAIVTIPPGAIRDRFYEMIEAFGFDKWPPEIDPRDAELIDPEQH